MVIIGDEEFDDGVLVKNTLDQHTIKFELIEVCLLANRPGRLVPCGLVRIRENKPVYVGANYHGFRWAERNWWKRLLFDADECPSVVFDYVGPDGWVFHFGWSKKSIAVAKLALTRVSPGHVIFTG